MSDAQWSARAKQLAATNRQFAADKNKQQPTEIQESLVKQHSDKKNQRELSLKISLHSVEVRKSLGQRDPNEVHAWLVEQLNNGMSLRDLRLLNEQRMLNANQNRQEKQEELSAYHRGLPEYHKQMQEGNSKITRVADLYQAQLMNYQEVAPAIEAY